MIEVAIWVLAVLGLIIMAFVAAVALVVFFALVGLTAMSVIEWIDKRRFM